MNFKSQILSATIDTICALLLIAGIMLAGSDGAWFPWINILGVTIASMALGIIKEDAGRRI